MADVGHTLIDGRCVYLRHGVLITRMCARPTTYKARHVSIDLDLLGEYEVCSTHASVWINRYVQIWVRDGIDKKDAIIMAKKLIRIIDR